MRRDAGHLGPDRSYCYLGIYMPCVATMRLAQHHLDPRNPRAQHTRRPRGFCCREIHCAPRQQPAAQETDSKENDLLVRRACACARASRRAEIFNRFGNTPCVVLSRRDAWEQ